jgi:uncharacterized membrane protein
MREPLNNELDRWTREGLIDRDQAARIRAFEAARVTGVSWPVRLALAFGGVMIAAGMMLFVSAHWDALSPGERFTIVLTTLAALHLSAALPVAGEMPAFRTTLHALGTVALGGAIFLSGQIFNLDERWSTGVLLWALGALIGWLLLDDQPQFALTAMLVPAWLESEWSVITRWETWSSSSVAAAGGCLLAVAYLTADERVTDSHRARTLRWIGGLTLLPMAVWLWDMSDRPIRGWITYASTGRLSAAWMAAGWLVALAGPLIVAYFVRRSGVWINAAAAAWTIAALNLWRLNTTAALYAWFAFGAVALAAWGVHESRTERINLGTAGFGLIVIAFYFSQVMDKLGRSASLVAFGILFLVGGWMLERTRRRLIEQASGAQP